MPSEGRGDRVGVLGFEVEDAGGEIHRSGEHPGEDHRWDVIRPVAATPRRVVFLPARRLPAEQVRVGPAEAGVLHRFVDVERHLMPRRRLDGALVVVHHVLPVVPLAGDLSAVESTRKVHPPIHVARLDDFDAEVVHERVRRVHLRLVVRGVAAGLVVANEAGAPLPRVVRQLLHRVVRVRSDEREVVSSPRPVAVPPDVPALDEHAVEAVVGGEVDVAAGVLGRRAVVGAAVPRPLPDVHRPPDADVLARLDPRDVAEGVRLVEVEDDVVRDEVAGRVADEDGSPRRAVRRLGVDADAGGPRREVGLKRRRADAAELHRGVVHERGLVERDEGAVLERERERRVERVARA